MKKRTLSDGGAFEDFKGTRQTVKLIPREQKERERKEHEAVAAKAGFAPDNPTIEGVLTKEDMVLVNNGMKLLGLIAMCNARKVELPEEADTREEITEYLQSRFSEEGEEVVTKSPKEPKPAKVKEADAFIVELKGSEKGKSIPEMKAYAKKKRKPVPSKLRTKADITGYILETFDPEHVSDSDNL